MTRLFLALFTPRDPELRAQLDAFKVAQVDGEIQIVAPRVIYAEPNRDKTHDWSDNDVIALELRKERESKGQPKVRRMPIREVK